jgi:hypothetical protein
MIFGLAWQATSIKGQWGAAMLELGRDPDPEQRVTFQDTSPRSAVDDPDAQQGET